MCNSYKIFNKVFTKTSPNFTSKYSNYVHKSFQFFYQKSEEWKLPLVDMIRQQPKLQAVSYTRPILYDSKQHNKQQNGMVYFTMNMNWVGRPWKSRVFFLWCISIYYSITSWKFAVYNSTTFIYITSILAVQYRDGNHKKGSCHH